MDPLPSLYRRALPALLVAVVLVYAPSLGGGYLDYDDPWLVESNPVLRDGSLAAVTRIVAAFDVTTRAQLGSEYLPVRDLSHWLEARFFGLAPRGLRVGNLLVYLGALLAWAAWLRKALGTGTTSLLVVALFALHPVHAESVAWIAGRKDVLCLLFMGLALRDYARDDHASAARVPLWMALAMLSKGVAVALPVLFLLHDWMVRRPHRRVPLVAASVVALAVLLVQTHVGRAQGMVMPPAGGTRLAAVATMGPVFARYVFTALVPLRLSVLEPVTIRTAGDLLGWLGWLVPLGLLGLGAWLWARDRRPLIAALWFCVALGPTSQVLVPLQNLMADRYLLVAVLGPLVLLAIAWEQLRASALSKVVLAAVFLGGLAGVTVDRAITFSDGLLLWTDATAKAPHEALPPYQLARALDAAGAVPQAAGAYQRAFALAPPGSEVARRAANNLGTALVRLGRLSDAEGLYRRARLTWPQDPKLGTNLAVTLVRLGRASEARAVLQDVLSHTPEHEPALRALEQLAR